MAPTVTMLSGHKSRISSTQGTRRTVFAMRPVKPQKNCGEVETMTSGFLMRGSASVAEIA